MRNRYEKELIHNTKMMCRKEDVSMKVKLLCEIEADVVDKEELEAIQRSIAKGKSLKCVTRLWTRILKEKLENICPYPVYENKRLNVKVDYYEFKNIQEFQLGDIVYMLDEDYRFFESRVCKISMDLDTGEYEYNTADVDFTNKDIEEWVFKTEKDRTDFIEAKCIDCNK